MQLVCSFYAHVSYWSYPYSKRRETQVAIFFACVSQYEKGSVCAPDVEGLPAQKHVYNSVFKVAEGH